MSFFIPSVSNLLYSGINEIFSGLCMIISYPFGIVGRFVCCVLYMLTNVYKFETYKKPNNKIFYKFDDKLNDRLYNNPSEYLFFLNNCTPVNDDHKHHKHHDHSNHSNNNHSNHSNNNHSNHDHSSYDHSSHDHSSYDHSSHDHSSSHHD